MIDDGPLLAQILQNRARTEPDKRAYVFLNEGGEEAAVLTYQALHRRACAVAERLRACVAPGDRAIMVFPAGLDFIVAFFGCLYAGVVAVPVNPPRRNRVHAATVGIMRDCQPAAVLTTAEMGGAVMQALDGAGQRLFWLDVDTLADESAECADVSSPSPSDVAFLQYTSGSTSQPKGVMVTHGNLRANEAMIQYAFGHDAQSTFVGWVPHYHDQGLIGNILQPLFIGATSILFSPVVFLRWPLLWLSAISKYRAHTSGGPNFAFEACVARAERRPLADLDLSSWRVAFNGAEPVRFDTMTRFAACFEPYGFDMNAFYPCYGLAEATLLVSGSEKGRGPVTVNADIGDLEQRRLTPAATAAAGRVLTSSGGRLQGEVIRIVDPATGRVCAPDEIGEIWVAGPHVASGYWQHPADTERTFNARLDADDGRGFLRTGDLGCIRDGELFVVGRLKDMIVIRGRNVYPQDVEQTVQRCHWALEADATAAFSVPTAAQGEGLVIVQEIARAHRLRASRDEVYAHIRQAVLEEHELAPTDIVVTLPRRLEKTSSGKIMREAARRRYLDGAFDEWCPAATASVV